MRNLFVVLLKVYAMSWVLHSLTIAASAVFVAQSGGYAWLASLVIAVVTALFAIVAITRAEKVADLVGLKTGGSVDFSGFSSSAVLKVGFILVGLAGLLRSLPTFIKDMQMVSLAGGISQQPKLHLLFTLLQLAIPLALILVPTKLIQLVQKADIR